MKKIIIALAILTALTIGSAAAQSKTESVKPDAGASVQQQKPAQAEIRELDNVVRIGGNILVRENERCGNAVAILGNADLRGQVDGNAVAIGGTLKISGRVSGNAVAVGGDVIIDRGAQVLGGFVAVGGKAQIDPDADVRGEHVEVGAFLSPVMSGVRDWLTYCLLKGRLIAPELPWTIFFFSALLAIAILLSALFRPLYTEGITLTDARPGAVFLVGVLALVGMPILLFMLTVTVIGIPLIPILHILLFGLGLIGMYSVFSQIGGALIASVFSSKPQPLIAGFFISVIFVLLAMVPILGILIVIMAKIMGIGAGVFAFIELIKRGRQSNQPSAGPVKPEPPQDTFSQNAFTAASAPSEPAAAPTGTPDAQETQNAALPPRPPEAAPQQIRFGTLWERLGAALIDFILVAIVSRILFSPFSFLVPFFLESHHHRGPFTFPLLLIYLIVMWGWKGTTIGKIVFHLQVRRVGGGPLSWSAAVVRGLGLVLSMAPLGLGFFWMAWDTRRQTWHDKIAGTEVVRLPGGVNLLE